MTALAVETRLTQNRISRERVRRMLGVEEKQLRSWEASNLVSRCDTYSFADLAKLRKIADLSGKKIPASKLKRLISLVAHREQVSDPLRDLHLEANGFGALHVEVDGQLAEADSGQFLLDFEGRQRAMGERVAFPNPAAGHEDTKKRREAEVWFERGLELEQNGAPSAEARAAYQKAIDLDPKSTGALVNLGTLHFNARQHSKAEKLYKKALEADPEYALAHFNLGNLYDERGDSVHALEHYLEALRLNPSYPDAHYNLALLYQSHGKAMQAVPHWRAYLKLDPRSNWSDIARRELGKLVNAALMK